jgi:8-oxo-dGTP pyrophosphatase MutT (NUDIX family)
VSKPLQQAGAIAFKDGSHRRFLLVTARRSPGTWIFPKGHVERGETVIDAALRELEEEAGVEGDAVGEVGTLRFRSGSEEVEVHYVLVAATSDGESREGRKIKWFPLRDALEALSFEGSRKLLQKASKLAENERSK